MSISIINSYSPRLDVNHNLISKGFAGDTKSEIITWSNPKGLQLGEVNIFIRISSHVVSEDGRELIGYVYEQVGNYSPTNIENDKEEISKFVLEAFLNHRHYYEENTAHEISRHVLIPIPPEKQTIEDLISHLKGQGFYKA